MRGEADVTLNPISATASRRDVVDFLTAVANVK